MDVQSRWLEIVVLTAIGVGLLVYNLTSKFPGFDPRSLPVAYSRSLKLMGIVAGIGALLVAARLLIAMLR